MGDNEYAIVTWGSSGIGKVMIHKFQSEGVVVHSLDIAVDTDGQVMPKNGVIWHKCDVSKANEVNQCIALITKDHPVDILVNNAVIGFIGDFLNTSEDVLDRLYNVNIKSIFHCNKEVIPSMQSHVAFLCIDQATFTRTWITQ
jgi:2-keto-3-deoxy-L-fuconate dehydrogenase